LTIELKKQQLVRLIRLLSSPIDGERLGAVNGIERILTSAGLSFHELAAAVLESELVVDKTRTAAISWINVGYQILAGSLKEYERKFVTDMISRFESDSDFEPNKPNGSSAYGSGRSRK
jgi:hypothetical protein